MIIQNYRFPSKSQVFAVSENVLKQEQSVSQTVYQETLVVEIMLPDHLSLSDHECHKKKYY